MKILNQKRIKDEQHRKLSEGGILFTEGDWVIGYGGICYYGMDFLNQELIF